MKRSDNQWDYLSCQNSMCPFSSTCVTLWQNEWWAERAEQSGNTAGICTEGLGRRGKGRSKDVVTWKGEVGMFKSESYPIRQWVSLFHGCRCPRLSVVLLPRSVDVVEQCHGERHAQQLQREPEGDGEMCVCMYVWYTVCVHVCLCVVY